MADTYLEEAVEAVTRELNPGDSPLLARDIIEAAEPHLEAHYREKLEARLTSDEAIERAARAAWEPERIVSWDHATRQAQADARKRIRIAFAAALKPDHTKTDERSSKEGD